MSDTPVCHVANVSRLGRFHLVNAHGESSTLTWPLGLPIGHATLYPAYTTEGTMMLPGSPDIWGHLTALLLVADQVIGRLLPAIQDDQLHGPQGLILVLLGLLPARLRLNPGRSYDYTNMVNKLHDEKSTTRLSVHRFGR